MKKFIALSVTVLSCLFVLNSCDPWEDDTFEDGGGGGVLPGDIMLLKEKHSTSNGIEGLVTFTYDTQNRMTLTKTIANTALMNTYTETTYQYPSEGKINSVTKTYQDGELLTTANMEFEILSPSTGKTVITMENISMTIDSEFSAPCGVTKEIVNIDYNGTPSTYTNTYEYSGSTCNSVKYIDGEWEESIFYDNKNPTVYDPMAVGYGFIHHNPVKIETDGEPDVNYTYEYNEKDYPISSVITVDGLPEGYETVEEFIYY